MRAFIFLLFWCFAAFTSTAQDTVERKNWLSDSVLERFYVLKSDQGIRQGPYKAYYQRHTLLATGNYKNNLKTGTWHFYNPTGRIVEKYNFDTREFLFEGPLDTADDLRFKFDVNLHLNDTITRPLKIGGSYYGYLPYVTAFTLPFGTDDVNTDYFEACIELLITPLGRLADYKVRLTSKFYQYDRTINLDTHLFDEADRTFVPAKLNGKPILSRVLIRCYVTPGGGLDFY